MTSNQWIYIYENQSKISWLPGSSLREETVMILEYLEVKIKEEPINPIPEIKDWKRKIGNHMEIHKIYHFMLICFVGFNFFPCIKSGLYLAEPLAIFKARTV